MIVTIWRHGEAGRAISDRKRELTGRGTDDIGWEVTTYLRKASFGECLLAGIVIALLAMVMDRITAAVATAEPGNPEINTSYLRRHRNLLAAIGLGLMTALLAQIFPALTVYPESWEIYPAQYMNDAVTYIVVEYAETINLINRVSCAKPSRLSGRSRNYGRDH